MKFISLLKFISECEKSAAKRPKVKNYDKIVNELIPATKKMLKDNGDFDIPMADLLKVMGEVK